MAVAPSSSPGNLDPKADKEEAEIPQSSSQIPAFAAAESPNPNPNPNPNPTVVAPPQPPSILPLAPSFRPMGASQYSVLPNPNFSMAMQPPGVNPSMRPMYPYAYGQPPMGYPGAPQPQAPMPMPPFALPFDS